MLECSQVLYAVQGTPEVEWQPIYASLSTAAQVPQKQHRSSHIQFRQCPFV